MWAEQSGSKGEPFDRAKGKSLPALRSLCPESLLRALGSCGGDKEKAEVIRLPPSGGFLGSFQLLLTAGSL